MQDIDVKNGVFYLLQYVIYRKNFMFLIRKKKFSKYENTDVQCKQ